MTAPVRQASADDVERLAPLFDLYRGFYGQASDMLLASSFLAERLERDESVVLLAQEGVTTLGFTQLYPSFSSVRARRTWILNDLFVAASARRRGIASLLLQSAAQFAHGNGALRLELETDRDNHGAQALYRSLGWIEFDDTLRFHLPLHEQVGRSAQASIQRATRRP